jgi:hypothetical protein
VSIRSSSACSSANPDSNPFTPPHGPPPKIRSRRRCQPALDISSLIDVCFLLLIYFLVTSTITPRETDLGMALARRESEHRTTGHRATVHQNRGLGRDFHRPGPPSNRWIPT